MNIPPKRIVLADDDEDDISLFKDAVQEVCPQSTVYVALDGKKVLDLLKQIPKPDAIVLDLNMPSKGGKECLVELRSDHAYDDVDIVILSTSEAQADITYCMEHGANYYFIKPALYQGTVKIVEDIHDGLLFLRSKIKRNSSGTYNSGYHNLQGTANQGLGAGGE